MSSKHDREQPGSAGEGAAVARAWRQASDEQPPVRLDGEILAAARQSVQEEDAGAQTPPVRPRARSRWMQWQPLAAAATVAGLAFALVQTLPRDREVAPPIRIEAPASAPAPAPNAALETRSGAPARAAAEATADIADSMREAETDPRKGVMTEASGEAYAAEAVAPAAARAAGAMAAPSAADRAARIEALHASGDLASAADALRAFRATDPGADSHLPEALRDWARTVE
jgi:hypothetical protein